MLLTIGPGVPSLQDYTMTTDVRGIRVSQHQGDTLDTFKCVTTDVLSKYTIAPEDDIVWLNDRDPNGFPTVNLLKNPNFSGTYSGGIAPNWTGSGIVAGVTVGQYGSGPAGTSTAQSITLNNVAASTTIKVYQNVTLPLDENGAVIANPGYLASVYVATPAALSGVANYNIVLVTNWYNGTSFISSKYSSFPTPVGITGWTRYSQGVGTNNIVCSPIPVPSGANNATIELHLQVNSTGVNSGQICFGAVQFEPCTFGNYRSTDFSFSIYNQQMNSTITNAVSSDGWMVDYNPAGSTFSTVSSPALYSKAQQISIANVATSGTTIAIMQLAAYHAAYQYTATVNYKVTSALTGGAKLRLAINVLDPNNGSNNYYPTVDTAANLPVSTAWQVAQISFGYGTSRYGPAITGSQIKMLFGVINNTSATNSGTIVIGSFNLTAVPTVNPMSYTTASAFGVYPTAYCGPGATGIYTDKLTSLYYRQQRYFAGLIRNVVYDLGTGAERLIEIDAVDYSILLNEAPATLLIKQQPDNLAIKQACDYAYNQGFLQGIDYTTYVQNILTVDAMLFNWQTTRDVLAKVADHAVAAYWVDQYKFLHYQQALATTAPFGISDNPDMRTTYPAEQLKIQNDSTNTLTTPVIEGSTQLSAAQTSLFNGYNTTLSAGITANTVITSIAVNAVAYSIVAGTYLTLSTGSTMFGATVSANVAASATSIPINSMTAPYTLAAGQNVSVTGYQLNNGNPVAQVDSCTIGGSAQTIGIMNVNSYSQGYTAMIDLQAGILYFNPPPASGSNNVSIVYRYAAPVIIRLHAPRVESPTGKVRRKIHSHILETTISSQQSAIDRANAELTVASSPKAIGEIIIRSPYTPFDNTLSTGQAIRVTYAKAGLSGVLYQIQSIETEVRGNNSFSRTLKIGYYRPDFVIFMAQAKRQQNFSDSSTSSTVLQDVLSNSDGWALGDSFSYTISNIGIWGSNANSSVWADGTHTGKVWG